MLVFVDGGHGPFGVSQMSWLFMGNILRCGFGIPIRRRSKARSYIGYVPFSGIVLMCLFDVAKE